MDRQSDNNIEGYSERERDKETERLIDKEAERLRDREAEKLLKVLRDAERKKQRD